MNKTGIGIVSGIVLLLAAIFGFRACAMQEGHGAVSGDIRTPPAPGGEFLLRERPATNANRPTLPPFPPTRKRTISQSVGIGLAIETLVKEAVIKSITRNRETAEMVGDQFQQIGRVFTQMETNGNFSAQFVEAEITKLHFPLESPVKDPYVQHTKDLIVTLYWLAYEDRASIEGDSIDWLKQITKTFKTAISQGLKATGKVGLEDTAGVTR